MTARGAPPGPGAGYQLVPGNVAFRSVRRVSVEGNRFTHLGAQALDFAEDGSSLVIKRNVVEDTSGGGIGLNPGAKNRNNRIEDNWVHQRGA